MKVEPEIWETYFYSGLSRETPPSMERSITVGNLFPKSFPVEMGSLFLLRPLSTFRWRKKNLQGSKGLNNVIRRVVFPYFMVHYHISNISVILRYFILHKVNANLHTSSRNLSHRYFRRVGRSDIVRFKSGIYRVNFIINFSYVTFLINGSTLVLILLAILCYFVCHWFLSLFGTHGDLSIPILLPYHIGLDLFSTSVFFLQSTILETDVPFFVLVTVWYSSSVHPPIILGSTRKERRTLDD